MNKPLIHRGHENNILVEKNVVVAKIVINIVLFLVCIIGFIGVSYGEFSFSYIVLLNNIALDKPKMIMPFIVYEFLLLLMWITCVVLVVLVMAVYLTTSVDITTTVR